jgi:hypothetical protein
MLPPYDMLIFIQCNSEWRHCLNADATPEAPFQNRLLPRKHVVLWLLVYTVGWPIGGWYHIQIIIALDYLCDLPQLLVDYFGH